MDISAVERGVCNGDFKLLARSLTVVENELEGYQDILRQLKNLETPIIGITGPPGAGKSTIVNNLVGQLAKQKKKIAVLAVDPTSPFNFGSLLGDRVRMTSALNNNNIYVRSIATRGSLGGLSAKAMELTDVLKNVGFDFVFVETVGVGQSEVEIAGLADLKIVVLVPESGDEIQHIKSGLMEIADLFVVNKSDRDVDGSYHLRLKKLLSQNGKDMPVLKMTATSDQNIDELLNYITQYSKRDNPFKDQLLFQKAWNLIVDRKTKEVDKVKVQQELAKLSAEKDFNLYDFVEGVISHS